MKPTSLSCLRSFWTARGLAFARITENFNKLRRSRPPVERLFIEAPGEQTVEENVDLFVHRGQVARLGRAAAAIALYTLQAWAPAGGAGIRTGLRGGGPLVTLVLPEGDNGSLAPLWRIIWANVPEGGKAPEAEDFPRVFPWLWQNHNFRRGRASHPATCPPIAMLVGHAAPDPAGVQTVR